MPFSPILIHSCVWMHIRPDLTYVYRSRSSHPMVARPWGSGLHRQLWQHSTARCCRAWTSSGACTSSPHNCMLQHAEVLEICSCIRISIRESLLPVCACLFYNFIILLLSHPISDFHCGLVGVHDLCSNTSISVNAIMYDSLHMHVHTDPLKYILTYSLNQLVIFISVQNVDFNVRVSCIPVLPSCIL